MSQHFLTIKHTSKSGKLNGVGKIFPYLFDLNKYSFLIAIHFIIDDVEASHPFQTNGSEMIGVLCFLTLEIISQHSIGSVLQSIQRIIINHKKDWHDGVTYQTSLGTFSFWISYGSTLIFSSNFIYYHSYQPSFPKGNRFPYNLKPKIYWKWKL